MKAHYFLIDYVLWHYTRAIRDGLRIMHNIVWFLFHFFSISLLARTLFSPFEKLNERYPHGFDTSTFVAALIVNVIMRGVGTLTRLVVISIGLLSISVASALTAVVFVGWIIFPVATIAIGVLGVLLMLGV